MKTVATRVKNLIVGDVVVNLDGGQTKTVLRFPQKCRAAGYVWVTTSGEAMNCHGSNVVQVLVAK